MISQGLRTKLPGAEVEREGRRFECAFVGGHVPVGYPFQDFCPAPFVPYRLAFRQVLLQQQERYDWNPYCPPLDCSAGRLYRLVAKSLPRCRARTLGLYVSLGSNFDSWHGADLFFFFSPHRTTKPVALFHPQLDQSWRCLTIDLAVYQKSEIKADYLITSAMLHSDRFTQTGRQLASLLERRVGQRFRGLKR